MSDFQQEVSSGDYQVVAIGFTVITMSRVLRMVTWLKAEYPGIEVVLGGYGTAVFKDPDAAAVMLQAKADAICYGEGVAFMRAYLRDRWGIACREVCDSGEDLNQDFLPMRHCFFRTSLPLFKQIVVLGSLGCTFGCPFCATSSQFDRKRLLVASGRQLFDLLLEQAGKHPEVQSAIVYDEDFLIDRSRVLEFMHLMDQCTELRERPLLLTVFASVRTVRMYTITELIRCGIGTIFIGVESFEDDVLRRESLRKRDGDAGALFEELHRHGINTLGSLILGWDGQTPERMREESRRFVLLNPTFYQVVPLHPVPGTPLWKKLRSQNRMLSGYRFEDDSIDRFTFELRDASRAEALEVVSETYRRLVEEGGPWPFRYAENLLRGVDTLARSNDPALRSRAAAYRRLLVRGLPLAVASRFFFRGGGFVRRWQAAMRSSWRQFPVLSFRGAAEAFLLLPVLVALYAVASLLFRLRALGDQPAFLRLEYAGDLSTHKNQDPRGKGEDSHNDAFTREADVKQRK